MEGVEKGQRSRQPKMF